MPIIQTESQQLADLIVTRLTVTEEIIMATITDLAAQIRTAYAKELRDIDSRLASLQSTLEDRAVSAEEARDAALAEVAALQADRDSGATELQGILDEMAQNDLPEDAPAEPEQPVEEPVTDPEAPVTDPTEPVTDDPAEQPAEPAPDAPVDAEGDPAPSAGVIW